MKYLAFVLLLLSLTCAAEIYMQRDKNGNAVYSDTPLNNTAQKVNLPPPAVISTKQPSTPIEPHTPIAVKAPEEIAKVPYTSFIIESPKNEETIQNQPTFSLHIKVEPTLQKGDAIQVYVDGKAWGSPVTQLEIPLTNIDRGTHQLSAALVNSQGEILKQTTAITLYIHRANVGNASTIPRAGGPLP